VEVVSWGLGVSDWGVEPASLPAPNSQLPILQWNVQSLARSHGITRAADLARLLGQPRQGLYGVWRGTAASVSVARLELLALRLGSAPDQPLRPGEWFQWDERGRLVWSIRDVAEQVGLDATQLAFAAGQYPQQMSLFWDGTAKCVFVDTLARLASALETEARPLDIGELFVRVAGCR
jgi:transcriptional regulator with XRE-family HTH domain